MKCFYHQEKDAVGICRHCLKGICNECAVDFNDGIACKDRCEEKAIATSKMLQVNLTAQKGLKITRFLGPIFIIILGFIYIGWAWYCDELFEFMGMTGIVFFVFGLAILLHNLKYIRPTKKI